MAKKFFSADLHLGHSNICIYAGRSWVKPRHLKEDNYTWISQEACLEVAETMNFNLIHRWNERIAPEDTVYHIGDFCIRGRARGYEGLRRTASEYEKELNGKIIHILGNHDENNGVKHGLNEAVITINGRRFLMRHQPYSLQELSKIPSDIKGVLCGHVHDCWTYKYSPSFDILQVNVGVDVCNYYPLTQSELTTRIKKYKKEINDNRNNGEIEE